MHAQMSSFIRFISQRSLDQVYKKVDRVGMCLVYVTPLPIPQIINMPTESENRIINTDGRKKVVLTKSQAEIRH
jgi:hypothetical protein